MREMKRNVSVVCVCSAPNCCDTGERSGKIIKEMPLSIGRGTYCITFCLSSYHCKFRQNNGGSNRFYADKIKKSRSQWPRGLRRRFAADRLLRLWVLIPAGTWTYVCCKFCVC